jgi:hypothetical protein
MRYAYDVVPFKEPIVVGYAGSASRRVREGEPIEPFLVPSNVLITSRLGFQRYERGYVPPNLQVSRDLYLCSSVIPVAPSITPPL